MIPKVAHFYWYGEGPLPALRQASVDSFQQLNPDWQVFVHRSGEDEGATLRTKINRSDAARYGILSRAGGVYFDTDIVFVRPIPEAWLAKNLLLPCTAIGEMYGVHVLGSEPESSFFRHAVDRAKLRMESTRILGCQSLGVKLWEGTNVLDMAAGIGADCERVPVGAFLLTGWQDVEDLWSPNGEFGRGEIGIHWYGGDPLSREFENRTFDELPDCPVKKALGVSRVAV